MLGRADFGGRSSQALLLHLWRGSPGVVGLARPRILSQLCINKGTLNCVIYLMFPQQKYHTRQQQLGILMASQKHADHVISELPLAQDLRVARRDHAAAQPICRRIVMLMSMTPKHRRTQFIREFDHELSCSIATFDGEEVQNGEIKEKGLEDLTFHGELEGV